jgi:hypothetical protein
MIGEQVFDALGKRFTLFLGTTAQCAIEEQYDRGFFAVVADAMPGVDAATAMAVAQSMTTGDALPPHLAERAATAMRGIRMTVLRDLAWHGLRRHHPGLSLDDVGDVIDDLGQEAFGEIMGRAIRAAQGQAKEAGGVTKSGKPARRATSPRGKTGPA